MRSNLDDMRPVLCATYLDPKFKRLDWFSNAQSIREYVKTWLRAELIERNLINTTINTPSDGSQGKRQKVR
jgi:hypothetical protein